MADADTITPEQLAAWRTMLVAHAELIDRLGDEMEAETGLPLSWYQVLLDLDEAEGQRMRMHELAGSLLLSRSAVTRFIDRMEQAGLVHRVECPSDRRGTFVAMTDEGRAVFRKAAPLHLKGIGEHFARHVSEDEAAQLTAIMNRLISGCRRAE